METQLEVPKKMMQLEPITEEQIRQMNRSYNPAVWDKTIDRFASYGDIQFYVAPADKHYSYDRYYAVYNTDDGVRMFNEVCYSTSLTSKGFAWVIIPDWDGGGFDKYGVYLKLFSDKDGNQGRLAHTEENRRYMAENSQKWGDIYTNIL